MDVRVLFPLAAFFLIVVLSAQSGDNTGEPDPLIQPVHPKAELSQERILGVIPNFQCVDDPHHVYTPLAVKQKFELFVRETIDPFTFVGAAMGAAISHADNDDPRYGQGIGPYAERFGAAYVDIATQNFFSDAVFASWFHEDPRYFRRGPEYSFRYRVGYAISRIVITRKDSGKNVFNYSGILGMVTGIALSNAYYPPSSVNAPEFGSRVNTSLISAGLGNLLPEFWPDIHERLLRLRKHKPASSN